MKSELLKELIRRAWEARQDYLGKREPCESDYALGVYESLRTTIRTVRLLEQPVPMNSCVALESMRPQVEEILQTLGHRTPVSQVQRAMAALTELRCGLCPQRYLAARTYLQDFVALHQGVEVMRRRRFLSQ